MSKHAHDYSFLIQATLGIRRKFQKLGMEQSIPLADMAKAAFLAHLAKTRKRKIKLV